MVFDIHREAAARKTLAFSRFPQAASTTAQLRSGKEGRNNLIRNPPQQGYHFLMLSCAITSLFRTAFRSVERNSALGLANHKAAGAKPPLGGSGAG